MMLLIVSVLMIGCVPRKEKVEITFKKNNEIEVFSKVNPCELVEELNKEKVNIDKNKLSIQHKKWLIECPLKINTEVLGTQTLKYKVSGKEFKYEIKIVDTTKPIINAKNEYEVETGNKYFNVLKEVDIKDNYSKYIELGLNGKYDVNTEGKYEVEVVATDENQNQTKKKIIVFVKPKQKEKEVVEVERVIHVVDNKKTVVPTQKNTQSAISTIPVKPERNNVQANQKKEVYLNKPKLPKKQFLFKDGYTFNNVFEACSNYLNQSGSGSCIPLKNGNVYIGYEYRP